MGNGEHNQVCLFTANKGILELVALHAFVGRLGCKQRKKLVHLMVERKASLQIWTIGTICIRLDMHAQAPRIDGRSLHLANSISLAWMGNHVVKLDRIWHVSFYVLSKQHWWRPPF